MKLGLGLGLEAARLLGGFSPISRSPTVWLDSSLGITTSTGNVTAWADQSGNNNNGTQSGTGPTFNATDAALSGKPSVALLGSSRLINSSAGLTVAQPNTVYVVGYVTASSGELWDGQSSRQTFGKASAGAWQYFAGGSVPTGGSGGTAAHCFCGIFNGNTSSALYVDNSSVAVISGGSPGTNSLVGYSIPGVAGANGGAIAALIIISGADTQAQRLQMFTYLGARFGISVS